MPQGTEKRKTEGPHEEGNIFKNCISAIVFSVMTCWLVNELVLAKQVVTIEMAASHCEACV